MFSEAIHTPPRSDEFEITFFGPGFGESIILHIPAIGWGVIDCCTAYIDGKRINLPIEYLNSLFENKIPRLQFAVLTHLHEDHFRGFDEIINDYPGGVEKVFWYGGDGIKELATYIATQRIAHNPELMGFQKILKSIYGAKDKQRLNEMTLLFDKRSVKIDNFEPIDIRIIALSPSAEAIKSYVDKLFSLYPSVGEKIEKRLTDNDLNKVSVALLIEFGPTKIILGSDVECGNDQSGWKRIIDLGNCNILKSDIIKIPHHGSPTSFEYDLWHKVYDSDKTIALLSPFVKGSVILPDEEVLSNISTITKTVGITTEIEFDGKLTDYYPRDVAKSIDKKAKSFKIINMKKEIGFLRVRFHPNGDITECEAFKPAHWV